MATTIAQTASQAIAHDIEEVDIDIINENDAEANDEVDFDTKKEFLTEFCASDNQRIISEGNIILHQIDTINFQKIFIDLFNEIYSIQNTYDKNFPPFIIARKLYVNLNNFTPKYKENSISVLSTNNLSLIDRIPTISNKFDIDLTPYVDLLNKVALFKHPTQEVKITFDINCIGFAEFIQKLFEDCQKLDINVFEVVVSAFYNFFNKLNNFIITVPEKIIVESTVSQQSHISSSNESKTPVKNQCNGITKSTKKQCQKPSSKDCFTSDGKSSCKAHAGTMSATESSSEEVSEVVPKKSKNKDSNDNKSSNDNKDSKNKSSSPKNQCHGLKKDGSPCGVSANKSGNFMTVEYEGKAYPTCHHHGGSAVNIALLQTASGVIGVSGDDNNNEAQSQQNTSNIPTPNPTPNPIPPNSSAKKVTDSKTCHGITGKKTQCSKSATVGNTTEDGYPACYQHVGKKSCM